MKYFLGIDGGGTKTAFTLIDENLNIIKEVVLGPTSIDTVDLDTVFNTFKDGINKINHEIDYCFAGLGGMASNDDNKQIEEILSILLPNIIVQAGSDSENALYGAFNSNDGIAVISGTGSVSFGKWKNNSYKSGGLGYMEGDAGSAYSLGIEAVRYTAKTFDNRAKESDFSKAISNRINCFNRIDMVNYFKNINRTEVAKLATTVTEYENNDIAKQIMINSCNDLINQIQAVYNKLDIDKECPFSIIGSLGNANTFFRSYLLKSLNDKCPLLKYQDFVYDAPMGACLKAKSLMK